jgi:hypothetical protein
MVGSDSEPLFEKLPPEELSSNQDDVDMITCGRNRIFNAIVHAVGR